MKKQLLRSKKLRGYFEENEKEKKALLGSIKVDEGAQMYKHLATIPFYAMPKTLVVSTLDSLTAGRKRSRTEAEGRFEALLGNPTAPELVRNLHNYANEGEEGDRFAFEDPRYMHVNELEPTSGRKLWKLRHKKRAKKLFKRHRDGFIGTNL